MGKSLRYETVGRFRSRQSGKCYLVKRRLATKDLSCNCQGWIYYRRCKHVTYVQSHPYVELTDIPTYQEAIRMDFGRNLEAKEKWTVEHLKDVVL